MAKESKVNGIRTGVSHVDATIGNSSSIPYYGGLTQEGFSCRGMKARRLLVHLPMCSRWLSCQDATVIPNPQAKTIFKDLSEAHRPIKPYPHKFGELAQDSLPTALSCGRLSQYGRQKGGPGDKQITCTHG